MRETRVWVLCARAHTERARAQRAHTRLSMRERGTCAFRSRWTREREGEKSKRDGDEAQFALFVCEWGVYVAAAAPCAIRSFQKAARQSPLLDKEKKRERKRKTVASIRCICEQSCCVAYDTLRKRILWKPRDAIRRRTVLSSVAVASAGHVPLRVSRDDRDYLVVESCALSGDRLSTRVRWSLVWWRIFAVSVDEIHRLTWRDPHRRLGNVTSPHVTSCYVATGSVLDRGKRSRRIVGETDSQRIREIFNPRIKRKDQRERDSTGGPSDEIIRAWLALAAIVHRHGCRGQLNFCVSLSRTKLNSAVFLAYVQLSERTRVHDACARARERAQSLPLRPLCSSSLLALRPTPLTAFPFYLFLLPSTLPAHNSTVLVSTTRKPRKKRVGAHKYTSPGISERHACSFARTCVSVCVCVCNTH